MKVIAINGSPRKNWNTSILLENALKGAVSSGAETELIHLYDLNFKGCKSCFACKKKGSKNYGKCVLKDELTPVLEKIENADVLIMGSPIYLRAVTGEMRSFLERLIFQKLIYSNPSVSAYNGNLKTGFIYTMNYNEDQFNQGELKNHLERQESIIKLIFGNIETFHSYDTYQMEDYKDIEYTYLDKDKKKERREIEFPKDCENAFKFGVKLINKK